MLVNFSKSASSPIWFLLPILTACTPPNYAPVKTVNEAIAPNNDYEPVTNPNKNKDQTPSSGKSLTNKPNGNSLQQESSNYDVTPPEPIDHPVRQFSSIQPPKSTTKSSKQTDKISSKHHKSEFLPENRESNNKKNRTKNNGAEKKLASIKPKETHKTKPLVKPVKNKTNLTKTATLAVQSSERQDFQPTVSPSSLKKNDTNKKSSISIINKKMLKLSFDWPMLGKIIRNFSQTDNKGIDIRGKMGQTVRAAEAGKAVYCGQGLTGFGNLIVIKHSETYLSAYAHNSTLHVREGQKVERGQKIGQLGATGLNKALLHFEIRKNGKSINPLILLPKL